MAQAYIPIPVDTVTEAGEQPSLTYRLDLDAGRIAGMVDGLTAVEQAIRKAIITPRFKCLIYDSQYGSEIEDALIAKDASYEYIRSATEGFIKDCLKPDTRVLNVYDFSFEFSDNQAYIFFRADTIFGTAEIGEVI